MTKISTVELFPGTPHVFLATPSYDGKVGQAYTVSILHSLAALKEAGFGVTYCLMGGNCHVDDARNGLVREFMMTECTDLVFLDADVGWSGESLVQLLRYDRDMVAGVYPKRVPDGEEYPVKIPPDHALYSEYDGLVEVEAVPTGFLRMTRHCIEMMIEEHGQRKYAGQNAKEGDPPYIILFERTFEGGQRRSGDYAFCRKWQIAGGRIYVDPRWTFIHEGDHEWSGCLGDHWLKVHGVTEQIKETKFGRAIAAIKADDYQPEHLLDLMDGWDNKWAGRIELLDACITLGKEATGPILECGSGLTTLVLGIVSKYGVISLEHSPVWASYTESMLKKYGIEAEIRCAPLADYGSCSWYQAGELPEIALVVCDGPPRKTKGGRNGLALMGHKTRNATFILDDPAQDTIDAINNARGHALEFVQVGSEKPIAISMEVA